MYERAVTEDPNFALAWAALSRTHVLIHWFSIDRSEDRLARAREAAERALQLSPDLPEAHLAMGDYHYRSTRDYVRALSEYALAEQGMPGNVQILEAKAYIQRRIGQWEESIASMDAAIQLDPRNIGRLLQQGHTFRALKRFDEAERLYARALEISPDAVDPFMHRLLIPLFRDGDVAEIKQVLANPPFPLGDWDYDTGFTVGLYERDYDAALAALARHVPSDSDTQYDLARIDLMAALTHQLAGRADEARTHYESALAKLEAYLPTDPSDPRTHIAIGEALAGLGRNEEAIRSGQQALLLRPVTVDAIDGQVLRLDALISVFLPAGAYNLALRELDAYLGTAGGGWTLAGILPDPRFDPVRDMPEFTAIEEKYAAP
jgi:tetratricopeptide (TPR) repeat protein